MTREIAMVNLESSFSYWADPSKVYSWFIPEIAGVASG